MLRWTLLLLPAVLMAQPMARRIDTILASTPQSKQAHWGIRVVDLSTGTALYQRNPNHFFTPASNTKLFSTSLALSRLGPDHKFITKVVSTTRPDAQGRLQSLRLIGGGDPNLSARVFPYKRAAVHENPLEALEKLADALIAQGVKEVTGDVVGDDTAYFWEPYPDGWSTDDPTWEYGAPVSALIVNDNAFKFTISPGTSTGDPGQISVWPSFENLIVHNRTRTSTTETNLTFDRLPGLAELTVSGSISKVDRSYLAIDDPAFVAAQLFLDILKKRGVVVNGGAKSLHRREDDPMPAGAVVELASHSSLPLIEDLRVINKDSQNLHAEVALREVARAANGVGSRKGGLDELTRFLTEIGVAEKQYKFYDGSGLSRMTLISPMTITKLLVHMYGTRHREAWVSTLPIGGVDGTLHNRFGKKPEAARILAKTGTISHVAALSGYANRKDGKAYAFSILLNHFNGTGLEARKLVDQVALALLR